MILHIINQSPYQSSNLATCRKVIAKNDSLLLIEDGVIAGLLNTIYTDQMRELLTTHKVFALKADIEARGFTNRIITDINTIDYAGFVDLVIEHSLTQSWN